MIKQTIYNPRSEALLSSLKEELKVLYPSATAVTMNKLKHLIIGLDLSLQDAEENDTSGLPEIQVPAGLFDNKPLKLYNPMSHGESMSGVDYKKLREIITPTTIDHTLDARYVARTTVGSRVIFGSKDFLYTVTKAAQHSMDNSADIEIMDLNTQKIVASFPGSNH